MFSWSKLVKKVIGRALQGFIAWAIAEAAKHGVQLDESQLLIAALAGLEGLRNFLKHKAPSVFGWL